MLPPGSSPQLRVIQVDTCAQLTPSHACKGSDTQEVVPGCAPPDLARAAGAVAGLGVNPAGVSIAYLTRSATDRDSWGPGQPLDGYQFNYTLSFTEAPPASATWRRAARPRAPCSLQQRPAYMLHCLLNYI